jgi:hypothetical protein
MSTAYLYDRETGEYLGGIEADLDPLEGQPLLPAWATWDAPPTPGSGESAVFDRAADAWMVVADARGQRAWSKTDGTEQVVTALGPLPADWTTAEPPAHATWSEGQWAVDLTRAKQACLTALNASFEAALASVQSATPESERATWARQDDEARGVELGTWRAPPLLSAIAAARGVSVEWLAERVRAKSAALADLVGPLVGLRQKLEDQVEAATSLAELEACKWPSEG